MPSQEVFSLGTLVFDAVNFEVPEDLELGKTTLGGTEPIPQTDGTPAQKASQTIGVVCDTIKFEAWFIGPNAETNGEKLEALQLAQGSLVFQRGARTYDVVIFHVSLKYHSANEIGYAVELEPLSETTAAGSTQTASSTSAISTSTSAIDALIANAPTDVRLADATQSAQDAAEAVLEGSIYTGVTSVADVSDQIALIVAAIDLLEILLGELAGSTAEADVASYLYAAELLGQLAVLSGLLGAATGAAAPGVNPAGMSVYELAVQYTGDIANSDLIMAANPSISDPFNLGTALITIPGI